MSNIQKKTLWIKLTEYTPIPNISVLVIMDLTPWGRPRRIEKANTHWAAEPQPYGGPNSLTGSGHLTGLYFSIPSILTPGVVTHWMPLPEMVQSQSSVEAALKSGRAFNGAHRDAGTIVHFVPKRDPTHSTAGFWGGKSLCGTRPGYRGNGWSDTNRPVSCEKCQKIFDNL